MKNRQTGEKRRKEMRRQEKQRDKAERRKLRAQERALGPQEPSADGIDWEAPPASVPLPGGEPPQAFAAGTRVEEPLA